MWNRSLSPMNEEARPSESTVTGNRPPEERRVVAWVGKGLVPSAVEIQRRLG